MSFKRYLDIMKYLTADMPYKSNVHDNVLTGPEHARVKLLVEDLAQFDRFSLMLQAKDTTLSRARAIFDDIIEWMTVDLPAEDPPRYPLSGMTWLVKEQFLDYLRADSDFVHSADFESAVVKLQNNQVGLLSQDEKDAVVIFKKPQAVAPAPPILHTPTLATTTPTPTPSRDQRLTAKFAADKRQRLEGSTTTDEYVCTDHVRPTTNVIERGFSYSSLLKSDLRGRMFPINLEIMMFLKANKDLWDITTLQECKLKFTDNIYAHQPNHED